MIRNINRINFATSSSLVQWVSHIGLKQCSTTLHRTEVRIVEISIMTAQKWSSLSFASIISVVSILLYCAGFLRVELELKDQKNRRNALENVVDPKASSSDPDVIRVIQN